MKQKEWDAVRVECIQKKLINAALANSQSRARLLAAFTRKSGYSDASPISSRGLHMEDKIRIEVGLRIGVPLVIPHPCQHCRTFLWMRWPPMAWGAGRAKDVRRATAWLMQPSREPCQQLGCLHNWNLRVLALQLAIGLMGSHWSHGSEVVHWHRTSLVQTHSPPHTFVCLVLTPGQ